jgi:uncharacterized membrane protein YukC
MSVSRSAMGKSVDMSALVARNEKVRAVGNMNVNARGDILDSNNKIIQDNNQRVKKAYNQAVRNQAQPVQADELSPEEKKFFDDDEDVRK